MLLVDCVLEIALQMNEYGGSRGLVDFRSGCFYVFSMHVEDHEFRFSYV